MSSWNEKSTQHLYCVLHQIHIQLFKLGQTMPNCHSQKRGERGLKSSPQNTHKIGSRLTTLGTTWPSFCPLFGRLTTCGPLKIGWNRLSFCQIWSNHIIPFRYSKSPENLDFPGFLNHFDIVWAVDYRLLNFKDLVLALPTIWSFLRFHPDFWLNIAVFLHIRF